MGQEKDHYCCGGAFRADASPSKLFSQLPCFSGAFFSHLLTPLVGICPGKNFIHYITSAIFLYKMNIHNNWNRYLITRIILKVIFLTSKNISDPKSLKLCFRNLNYNFFYSKNKFEDFYCSYHLQTKSLFFKNSSISFPNLFFPFKFKIND